MQVLTTNLEQLHLMDENSWRQQSCSLSLWEGGKNSKFLPISKLCIYGIFLTCQENFWAPHSGVL